MNRLETAIAAALAKDPQNVETQAQRVRRLAEEAVGMPAQPTIAPERGGTMPDRGIAHIAQSRCTEDGIDFDSQLERDRYRFLSLLERVGHIHTLTVHKEWVHVVNGVEVFTYKADFCYWQGDHWVIEDIKPQGALRSLKAKRAMITDVFRLKKRIVEAMTGIPIALITMDKNDCWVKIPLRRSR